MKVIRRSSQDTKWQDVKRVVWERDRGTCRLCRILTVKEFMILKKNAGSLIKNLDPAHYKAVSHRPDLCYEPNNICMVNHYSHSMLDDNKSPIDGSYITLEEAEAWWIRILKGNPSQYSYLVENGVIENEGK